ncbi:Cut9-interacting protein scn1 [Trichoderma ghanense]|uniref:Cut9-interacting protein scn1 n=1 Tax=Trichoderma ghanense TaxID=65468 RepID=A0ABY2GU65_9HYPO
MCQEDKDTASPPPPKPAHGDESFPWHLGAYDAHCHPTDTMSSLSPSSIAALRTRVLAIMATRSQDQQLVADVAADHGINDADSESEPDSADTSCKVVPAFGWHPWFSYQLYDDTVPNPTYNYNPSNTDNHDASAEEDAKIAHYQAVLSPTPQDRSLLSSLPTPTPLSSLLSSTREYLSSFPLALVGEVGLDKGFRLPQQRPPGDDYSRDENLTPGGREGRLLSPFRVQMQHQQAILQAQLRLAGEMGRAVSVHGVQAHGVLYDTIAACWKGHEKKVLSRRDKKRIAPGAEEGSDDDDDDDEEASSDNDGSKAKKKKKKRNIGGKPFPPRICLHSYSGSADMLKQWFHPAVPSTIFASFSTGVNMGSAAAKEKLVAVVRAVPDDRILVESDMHAAGDEAEGLLADMYRFVCEVKGWGVEEGVERIGGNFRRFVYG